MDKEFVESQTDAQCDICKHKDEVNDASHVCKQCRLFLCRGCSSKHNILPSFKAHVLVGLHGIDRDGPTASGVPETIDKMAAKAAGTDDSNVVDSDYMCTIGLETFFSAPDNVILTMVSRSNIGISVEKRHCNAFCLVDDRLCIHNKDEIVIFSREFNHLFAIHCSSDCAVIHTEGDTIAILNFFLYIDRYILYDKSAKLIDTIKIECPKDVGEGTVQDLFGTCTYPAFAYDDGHYVLFFNKVQCKQWCIFSISGKLLRQIPYKPDSYITTATYPIPQYIEYISYFRRRCEFYFLRFERVVCSTELFCMNGFGKLRKRFITCENAAVCFDGEYLLFLSREKGDKFTLNVEELATAKKRIFEISFSGYAAFIVVQKSLHRIIIIGGAGSIILGLSSDG